MSRVQHHPAEHWGGSVGAGGQAGQVTYGQSCNANCLEFLSPIRCFNHRWAWGRQLGGGSAKFRPGGSGFWTPTGGGNKFCFPEGGKGGDKRQNRKIFLIAAKRRQNFGIFLTKIVFFWLDPAANQLKGGTVVNKVLVWGGALFWTSEGVFLPSPLPPPPPLPTYGFNT